MKKIFSFLILIFSFINLTSQIPEIKWQRCFGTSEMDYCSGITSTNNGFMFALQVETGDNLTNYHGMTDIWIVNTDSLGNINWEKCFGGSWGEAPKKILRKSDNEYFVFGYTFSTDGDIQSGNNGYSDLWVVKINSEGNIIWENTYGCTGYDDPRDMILTPDDGFIMINRIGIGGGDVTNFYGVGDVWMCKCDSLGNIEWENTLGNHGLDNCVSLLINGDNNIMMMGGTQKHGDIVECFPDEAWSDVWLIELDLQGNILSQHCYGGSHYDLGYSIIELEDGYVFAGITDSNDGDVSGLHGPTGGPPGGWEDIWIVRLNEQFEIVWQKCIGGYDGDTPAFFSQTNDGGYIVIAYTFSHSGDVTGNNSWYGGYYHDIWVVKLSSLGEIEWEKCYGGVNDESVRNYSILKKGDFNYVIAGRAEQNSVDVQCELHGYKDAWIFEIGLEDTTGFSNLYSLHNKLKTIPNPATDYVIFEFDDLYSNFQFDGNEIQITDFLGKEVAKLLVISCKTVWDTHGVTPGIYFYSLNANNNSYRGKVIIGR